MSGWDQSQDLVVFNFISRIQRIQNVDKKQLYWHLWYDNSPPPQSLQVSGNDQRGRLQEWRGVPILKRSQFMKGRDFKVLINGSHRPQTRGWDRSDRWYCYWRSADVLQVSTRGRRLKFKPGNSIGFASVRRGRFGQWWETLVTPQGDARLSARDRFKLPSTGGILYYGEQPPRSPVAIRQPLWAGVILLGDGWMNGSLMRWSRQIFQREVGYFCSHQCRGRYRCVNPPPSLSCR